MSSTHRANQPSSQIPESLFQKCIQLVAKNLDLVDSFQGFPSLIGEKIFRCAINGERFQSDSDYESLSLNLFTEEFKEEVLSELNVSRQYLGLNYYIENFLMFKDLTDLDVSYCGLGDDHEILTHISTLKSLEKLVLSHNAMTDSGLQKMTTPHRMFRRGPEHLLHIDLTGNSVSLRCLKFLCPFKELQTVILPLQIHDAKQRIPEWQLKKLGYSPVKIVTRGWASSVIDRWMKHASATRKKPDKQSEARNFYCKSRLKSVHMEKSAMTESIEPPTVCSLATRAPSDKLSSTVGFGNVKKTLNPNSRQLAIVRNKHKQKCRTTKGNSDSERLGLHQIDVYMGEKAVNVATNTKDLSENSSSGNEISAMDAELLNQYSSGNKLSAMDAELMNQYSSGNKLSAMDTELMNQYSSGSELSAMDAELLNQYIVKINQDNSLGKACDSALLDKLTGTNIKPHPGNIHQSKPKLLTTNSVLKESRNCKKFHYNSEKVVFERKEPESKRWDNLDRLNPNKRRRTDFH